MKAEKRIIILFLLLVTTHCALSQSPSEIRAYINKYKALALEQENLYGIPAPITLAQGILESSAGTSSLAT